MSPIGIHVEHTRNQAHVRYLSLEGIFARGKRCGRERARGRLRAGSAGGEESEQYGGKNSREHGTAVLLGREVACTCGD
jgi:hypothetical protein